jgi:predicted AlkP superfamily pyrophosphatase or phosphodiesterase
VEPAFIDAYNGKESLFNKANRILELLDKPGQENKLAAVTDMRPQLIAAYVPNVDSDGHLYGPNSTEIRSTIRDVDNMLDQLFQGLETRNLTKIVNVVVVSDHGMATTDVNRLIQLEDLIDTSLIEHIDGWPLYGLRPKDPAQLQQLYDVLSVQAATNPAFDVYLRDKNMPERYHFSKNERIAPLWIIPKTGWAIVTKDEFDVEDGKKKGLQYHPKGLHGYDHEHPLMRAIFVARGPAFPHAPNSRVEPFRKSLFFLLKTLLIHFQKILKSITSSATPLTSSPNQTTVPCASHSNLLVSTPLKLSPTRPMTPNLPHLPLHHRHRNPTQAPMQ